MDWKGIAPTLVALAAAVLGVGCGDDNVEPPPPPPPTPTTITISPASATLQSLGETAQLTASVRDQNGQTMSGVAVTWSSADPSVATVNASGLVTAVANGMATVTATAGSATGAAAVTVAQLPVDVVVEPTADTLWGVGDTLRLSAGAIDANGNAVPDAQFSWVSGDTLVAVVDGDGLVTGVSAGDVEITAATGGVVGRAQVAVVPTAATLTVSPDTVAFDALGQTARLAAEVRDRAGSLMKGAAVSWSSGDTLVATVDSAGLATAVGNGMATVTATAGSASGTAAVTVVQLPVDVVVEPAADTLWGVGDTLRLTAGALDANGNAVSDAQFSWASGDTLVATVDADGLVTGVSAGEVEITATTAGVVGRAQVAVVPTAATLTVSPDTVAFDALGQTARLITEVRDRHGGLLEDAVVSWSSGDTLVASVDSAGLVTAVGNGTATVTATARSASGEAAVAVMQSVSSAVLWPATGPIASGDTLRLVAEAFDANGHPVGGAAFEWSSSDLAVARVNAFGLVTGIAEGRAKITAVLGDALGTTEITVMHPERAALVAFYNSTGGPSWLNSENWLTDTPLGEWHGVTTNANGRVVGLNLRGKRDEQTGQDVPHGLSGPIARELGDLTNLQWLQLGHNNLSGVIPPELGQLESLGRLGLEFNSLSGPIPPELGQLSSLQALELHFNSLSGPIPSQLGQLASLKHLNLGFNFLSGPIPPELGGLANAIVLHLNDNRLSGPIPPELGKLAIMERLDIDDNRLWGPVPSTFLALSLSSFDWDSRSRQACVPGTSEFVDWLSTINRTKGPLCNAADLAALRSLFEWTDGDGWAANDGWLGGPVLGKWHGVQTDSVGRVTALLLADNGLSGAVPGDLARLARLRAMRINGNPLDGRLPLSLTSLDLREFDYKDTELCEPADDGFQAWLDGIESHRGTGVRCPSATDRDVLVALHGSTGGSDWKSDRNWLSDEPLDRWHGVEVDDEGRVVGLSLARNGLSGRLPAELGNLESLTELYLQWNDLSGPIPAELGDLARLRYLDFHGNELSGQIPPELGKLANLVDLSLGDNALSGPIPPELGELARMSWLSLSVNGLSGPIPATLGDLANLSLLGLAQNELSGPIPSALGNLTGLRYLILEGNELSGPLPPQLGNLAKLEALVLDGNGLSGPVPPEIGGLASLRRLLLSGNAGLAGALPASLTALDLERLMATETDLCAPSDPGFQSWLATIRTQRITRCGEAMAYLVQAVQSRSHPVPLVAGETALLRVFVTAKGATSESIPAVRARFFVDGAERHVVDIPAGSTPIPTEVDEGDLSKSANAEIPGRIVRRGLEMVIEVDPEGTLDPSLGVPRRIPETGRLAVEVFEMPPLDLTVVPFLWNSAPDSSVLGATEAMQEDPAGHALLQPTHVKLPVGELQVTAHEPVASTSNHAADLLAQTDALRVLEGGEGHYMGLISGPVTGAVGVAATPGRSSFSVLEADVIAHELGHNMGLRHAPCGRPDGVDAHFPDPNGRIGAWGYDFREARLIPPSRADLMSYCAFRWIGDYHFSNAARHRLADEGGSADPATMAPVRSLLLWGGEDANGRPFLNPAFIADAPAALPDSAGDYTLTGLDPAGGELFSLSFVMPALSEEVPGSSFAFVLPVRSAWADALTAITLSGPDGTAVLDADSDRPMVIQLDPGTGRVRAFLDGAQAANTPGRGPATLFSRGLPDVAAWRR